MTEGVDPFPKITSAILRQMRVAGSIREDCLMEAWVQALTENCDLSRKNWRRALRSAVRVVRRQHS